MTLGRHFWLWLFGLALAFFAGAIILFAVVGWAWATWGGFGAFVFVICAIFAVAWVADRFTTKRAERLYGE
jgi:hypothetical protein